MPTKEIQTLDVRSRGEWREWLASNHDALSEIWLVFHKKHTGIAAVPYDDAVEEAICYGWVDSLVRRLDDDRYARKFTPRKADSRWSTANRRRYADLEARGLLAEPGLRRRPTERSGDRPEVPAETPIYILEGLAESPDALRLFEALPPSHRRNYVGWIDSAKRDETKARRIRQAVTMLLEDGMPGWRSSGAPCNQDSNEV